MKAVGEDANSDLLFVSGYGIFNKNGNEVTHDEKVQRAEEIADILSDNRTWKAHSRPLNIEALEKLGLKINFHIIRQSSKYMM